MNVDCFSIQFSLCLSNASWRICLDKTKGTGAAHAKEPADGINGNRGWLSCCELAVARFKDVTLTSINSCHFGINVG